MSPEDVAMLVVRLDERLKNLQDELQEAKIERKKQAVSIDNLTNKVNLLENQLIESAPVIKEALSIKQKLIGAGMLGKWVWAVGGGLLTIIYSCRQEIIRWLTKS